MPAQCLRTFTPTSRPRSLFAARTSPPAAACTDQRSESSSGSALDTATQLTFASKCPHLSAPRGPELTQGRGFLSIRCAADEWRRALCPGYRFVCTFWSDADGRGRIGRVNAGRRFTWSLQTGTLSALMQRRKGSSLLPAALRYRRSSADCATDPLWGISVACNSGRVYIYVSWHGRTPWGVR